MGIWRPGQKDAVLAAAKERGMIEVYATTPKPVAIPPVPELPEPKRPTHVWGVMNKTEAEFSRILDAKKARGEIVEWAFEPFALRLANKMTYTPDFLSILPGACVTIAQLQELARKPALSYAEDTGLGDLLAAIRRSAGLVVFDEVKGAQIWAKNKIKFRMAAEMYRWACFDLWQKRKDGWAKLL